MGIARVSDPVLPRKIIADIGGTNARFALVGASGRPERVTVMPVAGYGSFLDALDAYLAQVGVPVSAIAIAAAGPAIDGVVQLTNVPWEISASAVSGKLGGVRAHVINDLEAVARALPVLDETELAPVAIPAPSVRAPLIAVNVGTGFGAAVAIPVADGWVTLGTEAGHVRLGRNPFGDLTVEELFSGPGFQRVFGTDREAPLPERLREDYSYWLGHVVGNLVLATGSWGGVYFCGGVLSSFAETVAMTPFMEAFCDKGPMSDRMKSVRLHRITVEHPAFIGLAQLLKG